MGEDGELLALKLPEARQAGYLRAPEAVQKEGHPPHKRRVKYVRPYRHVYIVRRDDPFWLAAPIDRNTLRKSDQLPFWGACHDKGPIEEIEVALHQTKIVRAEVTMQQYWWV